MIRIGLMTLREDQELAYFTKLAEHGSRNGISVVRFTPSSIQPVTHDVNGFSYHPDKAGWVAATFPIPPFIYDRCLYTTDQALKNNLPIVDWIKKNPNVRFLGHGLPKKIKIYEALTDHPKLKNHVPHTKLVDSLEDIYEFLQTNSEVMLKPLLGTSGKGMIFIRYFRSNYEVQFHNKEQKVIQNYSVKEEFERLLNYLITKKQYMIQPFYTFQTRRNEPFNLRILLQKDEKGLWKDRVTGVRIGEQGHLTSNLKKGANTIHLAPFLKNYPIRNQGMIRAEIKKIITELPLALEEAFGPLFELVVDLGLDRFMGLYILECNSKPNHQFAIELLGENSDIIYEAPIKYSQQLATSLKS